MRTARTIPDDRAGTPSEPIAVVGLACRFPGADRPAAFWDLLRDGGSALAPPAPERRLAARPGGFLDDVAGFDPEFFDISPREAAAMDPQQRLALELGWEAFEDAGIVAGDLRGRRAGVFVGAMWDDYATLLHRAGPAAATQHSMTGLHRGAIANRVSYTFDLRGPSMVIDTGQSSSLVAVHTACESLRRGESVLALAGGVSLMLAPESTVYSEKFGALSPDGQCFTLDARANGYVRGEGAGFLVLKPLSAALADHDRVYCVIEAGAVNSGGASEGLTVPRAGAQEAVLREAYGRAGVDPADVQYVELHGTGTRKGDPVEAAALGAVFGDGSGGRPPLYVGSVKTNIGHLEAAAGVAGLIKTVLSIRHRRIPPSRNFSEPHPDIPLDAWRLRVPTEPAPWPREDAPLLAGVSSFGMGGTNCHVVLSDRHPVAPADEAATGGGAVMYDGAAEAAATGEDAAEAAAGEGAAAVAAGREAQEAVPGAAAPVPWVVTARSPGALRAQAARLREHVAARPGLGAEAVGYTLSAHRTAHEERAVVLGRTPEDHLAGLDALARGVPAAGLVRGTARDGGRTAFLFSGQGSQRPRMGYELHASLPEFAAALDEVCTAFDPHLPHRLKDLLFAGPGTAEAALLDETEYTQAALFAVESALYRLLRASGVEPDYLLGHSIGELTAAYASGVLGLADACALVAARGRLMQRATAGGAMAAVEAGEEEVGAVLAAHGDRVSIAALNGPRTTVVSGDRAAVAEVTAHFRAAGRRTKELRVSHAFHSAHMDGVLEEFRAVAAGLTYGTPKIPVVSNVTGRLATAAELASADYWTRHIRACVRYADGVRLLHAEGVTGYWELGPGGLAAMTRESLADAGTAPGGVVVPVLRDGRPEELTVATALAEAYVRGAAVDWGVLTGWTPARVELPTYAFQRRPFWFEEPGDRAREDTAAAAGSATGETAGSATGHADGTAPGHTDGTATGPVTGAAPAPRPAPESAPGPTREPGAEPLELVRTCVATVLGYLSTDTVDTRRTFKELGFDSLTAVEFRDRVAEATGLTGLPPTLIYNFPTPAGLAGFLQSRLSGEQSAAEAPAAAVPARHDEPIAIVGMSCRFPGGVRSPEDLWRLVADGRTGLSAFPDDREWPDVELRDPENPDVRYARTGGFLHDAAAFDAPFFGISPREALAMDPQQRLVLETSWEALERAGIDPGGLRGRQVGVFTGATAQDYGPRLGDPDHGTHGYLLTGSTPSVVSGRVAYALGLEGPALTVDTACSSSLAALHLAARSLSAGECALALAGGVTVMATPGMFVEFAQQRGLAPDGRCKPFARAADGTGWSEGVGMVVLERLSDARRHGHRVLAVLRGSAVNQDGASNGLTAPNGPSQERVIRQALADAGLAAGDVDVVEAHGTGTKLGDPIEAQALLATYGQGRDTGRPLRLGSVKSNIGHTQAAAGVAAVIKMVMALRHDSLPASLNIDEPTPYVDWSAGAVELLTEPLPWPRGERTRRAGVSSFGISGTNVHAILEEAPAEDGPAAPDPAAAPPAVVPWPLSARSPEALRGQAAALRSYLADRPGLSPVDVGHSLATTRAALEHRAVVVGGSREELTAGLDALLTGDTADAVVRAVAAADAERVFVFPGQGAQWARMAVELLDTAPVFAARMRECAAALDAVTDWSLLDVLRGEPGAPTLERVDVVQPVLFAMMVSLARLWESYGVRPTAVVGHSQGEIAAACVAGALSLEDAARIVALRSRALVALSGRGGMVSVALPDAEARRLPCWDGRLDVAVVNGPSSVVVSGEPAALDDLLAVCAERGVRAKRIPVSYAAHSAQVEAIREELMEALREVTPRAAGIPFYSTVTGDVLDTTTLDAAYWYRNLRETVRFERTMGTVLAKGHTLVLEISPHPVLRGDIEEAIASRGARGAVVGSLRRDDGGLRRFVTSVAEAHAHGAPVDWSGVFAGTGAARVELPTYAFQHERYWLAPPAPAAATGGADETHSAFWDIVARGDADGLAAELALPDEAALRAVLPALSAWHERQRAAASADSWRYRITWRPAPHTPAGSPAGGWLVLLDPATRESPLAAAVLGALGDSARVVPVDHYGADGGADGLAAVLRSLPAGGPEPSGVLLLAPPTPLGAAVPSRSGDWPGLLGVLRALGEAGVTAPLWCVTQGAVAVGGEELTAPVQAQLWGLGRVAAVEFPQRWGGLVDLPADLDPAAAGPLAAVLADPGGESQVALRTEGVFVRRLVRAPRQTRPGGDEPRFGGTVLVTGGTGALGRHTAAWLADRGAEHLVLVSRSGPAAPGADALQALLSERGVRVSTLACDVSDRAALAALLDGLDAAGDRIRAVVHTAGVIENTPLGELTPERFAEVLRAKADAALHLHDLTRDRELDAFVLFSSVSGMWGSTGNGGYAAANAFLDALALHRRGLGLPATSVIWGPWDGDGMMTRGGMAEAVVRRGLRLLAPEPATAALGRCLLGDDPTPVVADVDWEALAGAFGATRTTALFADLPEARAALGEARPAAEEPTQTLAGRLAPLSPLQRRETVSLIVRTQVARVLGYAGPDAVSEEKPFKDLGVDSVISVELRNRLQADTGLRLPVTVVFDHPTVAQLADLLLAAAGTGDDSASDDASGAGDDASVSRDAPGSDRERDRTRRIQHAQERINDMDADDLVRLALGER
ncbi:type I polyketide synthase [Streptomyces sp. NPDC051129]|uniref:type I polyketide synthase n=1 Tax=Streptomyces sp. NPDC051129 TaxID=3154639 RepID=UPI00343C50DD